MVLVCHVAMQKYMIKGSRGLQNLMTLGTAVMEI